MSEQRAMTKKMEGEALEVLEMVREGRVTPEQGAQLLAALRTEGARAAGPAGEKARFLRVRVNVAEGKGEGDKVAVNLNLPIAVADLALKVLQEAKITKEGETIELGQYLKDLQGVDVASILQMVKDGAEGKLLDVDVEEEEGDKVKVEVVVD